jgi:hypothetical protein
MDALINRVGWVAAPFSIELPDGEKRSIGEGTPEFSVGLRNERAMRALRTLDEGDIAEAYLQGDIDIEGDMLKLRAMTATHGAHGASFGRCCLVGPHCQARRHLVALLSTPSCLSFASIFSACSQGVTPMTMRHPTAPRAEIQLGLTWPGKTVLRSDRMGAFAQP